MTTTDQITVLIPTSPIPSHPSGAIILKTVACVKEHLPLAPIIITADGSFDWSSTSPYNRYVDWLTKHWGTKNIVRFSEPIHQSGMLVHVLDKITTPLLLYLEHDWEILPDIPWDDFLFLLMRGDFNTIKLHANPRVSPYYEHMMEDRVMYQEGVSSDRHTDQRRLPAHPFIRTRQWSQNPHLSRTGFYRDKILPLIRGKVDFIENIIHGIVANSPWNEWRTAIYNPADGDMMRVRHLDGKGTRL